METETATHEDYIAGVEKIAERLPPTEKIGFYQNCISLILIGQDHVENPAKACAYLTGQIERLKEILY